VTGLPGEGSGEPAGNGSRTAPKFSWAALVPAVILFCLLLFEMREIWHPLVLLFAFVFFCLPWKGVPWVARAMVTASILVLLWLVDQVKVILAPLAIGLALAYVFDPLVGILSARLKVRRAGRPDRTLASILVTVIVFGVPVALGAEAGRLLMGQANELAGLMAGAGDAIRSAFPESWRTSELLGPLVENFATSVEGIGQSLPDLSSSIGSGIGYAAAGFYGLLSSIIFFFYMVKDFDWLPRRFAARFLPPGVNRFMKDRWSETDRTLKKFLRGFVITSSIVSVLTLVALLAFGVRMALLLAILAGLLNIIPVVGFWVSTIITLVVAVAGGVSPLSAVLLGLCLAAINVLEGNILTPRIVGRRVGLHPVAAILSVGIFGKILGAPGVILGLPLAAILTGEWEALMRKASEDRII